MLQLLQKTKNTQRGCLHLPLRCIVKSLFYDRGVKEADQERKSVCLPHTASEAALGVGQESEAKTAVNTQSSGEH